MLGIAMIIPLALTAAACGGDDTDESSTEDDTAEDAEEAESTEEAEDSDEAEATDEAEAVTLRFSWWGGDSRHEYTQELIDLYMEQNPHVTIEADFTDWNSYWDKLSTTVAGGDTPDVMQHETRYIREYADNGVLADLNSYLGSTIETDNLDTDTLPAGQVGDATYAVPTGVNAYSLVVDPVAFEAAGVELPDDTSWTWDDYSSLAAEISASGGDIYGTQDQGYNEASLQVYLRQNGEDLYNEDGTDLGFTAETMAAWWQIGVDQRDNGAPSASVSVETQNGGLDQGLLSTNKGAMGFWWSNQLGALYESSGRDLELMRFPGGSEGMFLKPAMFWSMSADTEHPEEAASFINFMLNSQEAAEIMLTDRGLPVNLEIREAISGSLDPANQLAAEFVSAIGDEANPPPGVPPQGAGEVQEILQRLNDEVLFDQISIDDAVQTFMDEARAAIGA
jgi:multiple sugar transport system substrate-binding protein